MIDSETIRAARGGVAGENGRTPATAAENAADGDSEPLAGISRDTRERIEADAWEAARLDMSRTWEERRDAIVALLDRQARLTEREWDSATANRRIVELRKKVNALAVERDELRARLDALRPPRTLEDVLWDYRCAEITKEEAAAEIRELMGVDE